MGDGQNDDEAPTPDSVLDAVRNALLLPEVPLEVRPVTEHTNINYVFHVTGPNLSVFVKAATEKLKAFELRAPRSRVAFEAERAGQFRATCGHVLEVPSVVFLDMDRFMVGLEDVGRGRRVLLDVIDHDYNHAANDGATWGRALGTLGKRTRASGEVASKDRPLGHATWLLIMSMGATQLFPEAVETLLRPLSERTECLVHTDLWGKNILVGHGERPAIVDFENAGCADPAIDLSSLLTVFLIPALDPASGRRAKYAAFVQQFVDAYLAAVDDPAWGREILARSYHAVSANLAHRAVGMAPYRMSPAAKERAIATARVLFHHPPRDVGGFLGASAGPS